jgi:hypothetical protein
MDASFWERVGELADRAPLISDLRHHKLQLIAASRMRKRGEPVPRALIGEERSIAIINMASHAMLRRVRAAYDGPLVLMKGAEVAARWPESRLRPTIDVDLLAENADAAQAALLAAGFLEVTDPELYREDISHHRCPLVVPGLPLRVEIHSEPHWCAQTPPEPAEIVAAATAGRTGIDGILAPRPDHHALLLAGHAWVHSPLGRISHLVDVAVMLAETTPEAVARLADDWGLSRVWSATERAIDELLLSESLPRRAPIWKRHLLSARERTVFEAHVARIVAPVKVEPARRVPLAVAGSLANTVFPSSGETWRAKLRRVAHAIRHASWARSRHEDALEASPPKAPIDGPARTEAPRAPAPLG